MDIWTVPAIIVTIIICLICIAAVRKTPKENPAVVEGQTEVREEIEDHPFTLNPILWVILVATGFIGIVIFYYATSFY